MTRTLIATFLAATMAVTSLSATPARAADSGEIGRFLLGAGTLFIIGSALSNRNKHRPQVHRVHPYPDQDYVHRPRVHRKFVPGACFRRFETYNGVIRGFGVRCLRNNMRNFHALPGGCRTRVHVPHVGHRNLFRARCLRNNGWRMG